MSIKRPRDTAPPSKEGTTVERLRAFLVDLDWNIATRAQGVANMRYDASDVACGAQRMYATQKRNDCPNWVLIGTRTYQYDTENPTTRD